MWKYTKDEMDSAALIDYVWPLGTGSPETAGAEREAFVNGGSEWDEPLVGADIVDVWSPRYFDLQLVSGNDADHFSTPIYPAKDGLEISVELPPTETVSIDVVPIYERLRELEEEVGKDLVDSLLDGDIDIDSLEDIDLYGFFQEIEISQPNGGNQQRVVPPRSPSAVAGVATGQSRECLPSPAPSCDSGVSSASSSLNAPVLDLYTDEYTVTVGDSANVESGESESFETIDLRALEWMNYDVEEGEAEMEVESQSSSAARASRGGIQVGVEDAVDSTTKFGAVTTAELSLPPSPPLRPSPSPVDHFHSYAQKPVNAGEEEEKKGKKGRRAAKSGTSVELKKTKKKEQNKTAALRYRMKKKMETGSVFLDEREEERKNKELKSKVAELEREIGYLNSLMAEIKKHKKGGV